MPQHGDARRSGPLHGPTPCAATTPPPAGMCAHARVEYARADMRSARGSLSRMHMGMHGINDCTHATRLVSEWSYLL